MTSERIITRKTRQGTKCNDTICVRGERRGRQGQSNCAVVVRRTAVVHRISFPHATWWVVRNPLAAGSCPSIGRRLQQLNLRKLGIAATLSCRFLTHTVPQPFHPTQTYNKQHGGICCLRSAPSTVPRKVSMRPTGPSYPKNILRTTQPMPKLSYPPTLMRGVKGACSCLTSSRTCTYFGQFPMAIVTSNVKLEIRGASPPPPATLAALVRAVVPLVVEITLPSILFLLWVFCSIEQERHSRQENVSCRNHNHSPTKKQTEKKQA